MMTRKQFLTTTGAGIASPALNLAAAQKAPGSRPKNVVLLISDQHHPRAMSSMGDPCVHTPNLDRLAAESTQFSTAYCGNPVCGPSRASMMTGQYTHRHQVFKNDVPWRTDLRTMGNYFSSAGYLAGTIGKAHFADGQTHGYGFKLDFNEWYQYLGPKTHLYAEEMPSTNGGSGLPEVFSAWNGKDPVERAARGGIEGAGPRRDVRRRWMNRTTSRRLWRGRVCGSSSSTVESSRSF